jgi:hypothetical protein
VTDNELHWLAGWLEGEGSFVVTSGKSYNDKRYTRIRVNGSSIDKDVLDYVKSIAGGVVNGPYERTGGAGKHVYMWTLSTHKTALPLLIALEPLMVAARRKAQVRKAIEAAEEYMSVQQGKKGF